MASAQMDYYIDMDRMFKDIEGWEKRMDRLLPALERGIGELGDRLLIKLHENLAKYGLADSELATTAYIKKFSDGFEIGTDAEHSTFVEFGTGIVGAGTPHPRPDLEAWVYDSRGHGIEGWWYPTTGSDPNKKKFVNENGQWFGWTAGQISRPYLYDTWKYGTQAVTPIIRKHIRRALK